MESQRQNLPVGALHMESVIVSVPIGPAERAASAASDELAAMVRPVCSLVGMTRLNRRVTGMPYSGVRPEVFGWERGSV